MHQKQQVIVHIHDKPKKKRKARKSRPRAPRAPQMAPAIPQVIYNSTSHLNDVNMRKFENMADKIKALQQAQLTPRATVQENLPLRAPARVPVRATVRAPASESEYQSEEAPATPETSQKTRKQRSDKGKKRGVMLSTAERHANEHGASIASMLNPERFATMEAPTVMASLEMSGERGRRRERE